MPNLPAKRIATRVQELMSGSDITQTQAAAALHMSQSAFSRRYLGYVEFRASELDALAKLFAVEITDIVGTATAVSA